MKPTLSKRDGARVNHGVCEECVRLGARHLLVEDFLLRKRWRHDVSDLKSVGDVHSVDATRERHVENLTGPSANSTCWAHLKFKKSMSKYMQKKTNI